MVAMSAILSELDRLSRQLDPSGPQRQSMMQCTNKFVESLLDRVRHHPTFKHCENTSRKSFPDVQRTFSFAEDGADIESTLEMLGRDVFNAGVQCSSGRDFSYIPGGGLYPSALADLIADIANSYPSHYCSPGVLQLENSVIRWLADMVGFPDTAGGDLTSGGSIANLSAIVLAREDRAIGSAAAPLHTAVVYLTQQTHFCVRKGLHIAGLSRVHIRQIALDDNFRMDSTALAQQIEQDVADGLQPWLVVASAGTTCVGAVDPLDAIADIAQQHHLWFHVDAAYGGCFLLTEHGKKLLRGIERADTVVVDPHKGLFLPLGSGALLARDARKLVAAYRFTAAYAQDDEDAIANRLLSPCDHGPELSRPFRGLRLWLPLRLFGLKRFRAALDEKLQLASYFRRKLLEMTLFEVGPEPQLSVVCYRLVHPNHIDDDDYNDLLNKRLVEAVRRDGNVFVSSTRVRGRFTLRTAVLHFRTHKVEIDNLLTVLGREAEVLLSLEADSMEAA